MKGFHLSEVESRNVSDFIARQEAKMSTPSTPIGGRWTYSFTPTSIGMIIEVTDCLTKETEDVSDYESF